MATERGQEAQDQTMFGYLQYKHAHFVKTTHSNHYRCDRDCNGDNIRSLKICIPKRRYTYIILILQMQTALPK